MVISIVTSEAIMTDVLGHTSIFPVSGALQFIASGATRLLPMVSHMSVYSTLVKPGPS